MSFKKFNILEDIYYKREYISLYLKENEEIFDFKYEKDAFVFYTIGIKRKINTIGNITCDEKYYDLETVYGYGGVYCNTDDNLFLQSALESYQQYCIDESVIAEFTRFHPFNEIHEYIKDYYNFITYDRDTVYVDTLLNDEERWKTYSSNTRNILRKCSKELEFRKSTNITSFIQIYEATMKKNKAEEFYYFDTSYFQELLLLDDVALYDVVYDGKVIASSFFMFSEDFGHYHLSANDENYKKLNANYFILDCLFSIAHKNKKNVFCLGGGRTNTKDDSLLTFKKKFSPLIAKFYIAGKIYNKDVYDRYISVWESQTDKNIKYFLKYRQEL